MKALHEAIMMILAFDKHYKPVYGKLTQPIRWLTGAANDVIAYHLMVIASITIMFAYGLDLYEDHTFGNILISAVFGIWWVSIMVRLFQHLARMREKTNPSEVMAIDGDMAFVWAARSFWTTLAIFFLAINIFSRDWDRIVFDVGILIAAWSMYVAMDQFGKGKNVFVKAWEKLRVPSLTPATVPDA